MKIRVVGKGRRRTIRLTAEKPRDSQKLLALMQALATPPATDTREGR